MLQQIGADKSHFTEAEADWIPTASDGSNSEKIIKNYFKVKHKEASIHNGQKETKFRYRPSNDFVLCVKIAHRS